jgi:hypothetical protein
MTPGSWLDTILYSDQGSATSPLTLLFTLLLAFALGQMIGGVYLLTASARDYGRSFGAALVALPVIVSLLMMLMTGSLTIAFGLLAVFAVVRFRNVLRDTRDSVFVLWTIVEGMAVGTMRYSMAVLGAGGIALVLIYLRITRFGERRRPDGLLCVEVSGDPGAGRAALNRLFGRHALRWELLDDQTLPGQGLVLTYNLLLRDRTRAGDLRQEIASNDQLHEVSYVHQPRPSRKSSQRIED